MKTKSISRREFLRISVLVAAGAAATACAPATPMERAEEIVEPTEAEPVSTSRYNEAPMLAALVEAGELPPVDERLPANPQIVEPWHEIGEYGGVYTMACPSPTSFNEAWTATGADGLLRMGTDLRSVAPNIAESYEFTPDGKALTLFLRQGVKWSDGVPFTADDIMFWYEDILLNDEITPAKPTWLKPGGEKLATLERVDDFTVRFTFELPYPFVLKYLAHYTGMNIARPSHYLKQFHPAYVDQDELEAQAEDAGYDSWINYFAFLTSMDMGTPKFNPDLPSLAIFKLMERQESQWILERNPYYWKVDPEQNQLPYVDGCFVRVIADQEAYTGAVISGELDIGFGWRSEIADWPLYQTNQEAGEYVAFTVPEVSSANPLYQLNLTYQEDLVLRDIFRDLRFRIALSQAINRDELNELAYFGRGTPMQATVIPSCSYYDEKYAKMYVEYDPDTSNVLLDEMGLEWDQNHEWRLRPDGERVGWTLEAWDYPQIHELVLGYWQAIGLDVRFKAITGELSSERYPGNLVAMGFWGQADKCTDWLFPLTPQFWVPYNLGWETMMYPLWTRWCVSGGEEGEEPPEEVRKLWDLWQEMKVTVDVDKQVELGKEIVRINAENLYVLGTVGMPPKPVAVKDNLGNFPTAEEGLVFGWDYISFYPWQTEQLYLKHPLHPRQEV